MIVPMQKVFVLCMAADRDAVLKRLQSLGVMQIDNADLSALPPDASTLRIAALNSEREALEKTLALYEPFGDFEPADIRALASRGVKVSLLKDGTVSFADELPEGAELLPIPEQSPAAMRERIAAIAADLPALSAAEAVAAEARPFLAAQAAAIDSEGIIALSGWCPEEKLPEIRNAAKDFAICSRAPLDDEEPPVLLRPPRGFKAITQLFKLLGILPAYREADISVAFYAFFSLFFAMLVGDAGYGAVILAIAALLWRKMRKAAAGPCILLTVFALSTILWGVATGTYFGMSLPNHRLAKWIALQENLMQLCFFLGALHLSVARLWNAWEQRRSAKALAQIGWSGIVWTMYCVACLVVVPGFVFPKFMFFVAGLGTLLIASAERGIGLAMLPLNIISGLGDIISYVRLFAVGLASVKVAENFNMMATDLALPLWAKIPCMLLILLLGHGLNFAMGALSIIVHAVRLNTLEFSNHKGVSWSGVEYAPFK